jgi:hypothetical protein
MHTGDFKLFGGMLAYVVHLDMQSHTGGVYATSCHQKLGTKSSTEAELF